MAPHRYEAYVIALGIVANACALARWTGAQYSYSTARTLFLTAATLAVLVHGVRVWRDYIIDAGDVYRGGYQAARFLARFPPKDGVVVGDVGAVGYFADLPIVDANGLITLELVPSVRLTGVEPGALVALANRRDVRVEVSGDEASATGWERVAGLRVAEPTPSETVWFFAADRQMGSELRRHLHAYAAVDGAGAADVVQVTDSP